MSRRTIAALGLAGALGAGCSAPSQPVDAGPEPVPTASLSVFTDCFDVEPADDECLEVHVLAGGVAIAHEWVCGGLCDTALGHGVGPTGVDGLPGSPVYQRCLPVDGGPYDVTVCAPGFAPQERSVGVVEEPGSYEAPSSCPPGTPDRVVSSHRTTLSLVQRYETATRLPDGSPSRCATPADAGVAGAECACTLGGEGP